MTESPPHPEDATLFDLVDGTLDTGRTAEVQAHLEHCSACAAFVEAAREGAAALHQAAVTMPADTAERLQLAVADAWDQQHSTASPPVEIAVAAPQPAMPPATSRSRWSRIAMPAVAFAVLALLAGTSVFIVEDRPPSAAKDAAVPNDVQSMSSSGASTTPSDAENVDDDTITREAADGEDALADAAVEAAAPVGPAVSTAKSADLSAPDLAGGAAPTTATTETVPERTCFATTNESRLVLPDGRIPQRIITGPLGILIVCG